MGVSHQLFHINNRTVVVTMLLPWMFLTLTICLNGTSTIKASSPITCVPQTSDVTFDWCENNCPYCPFTHCICSDTHNEETIRLGDRMVSKLKNDGWNLMKKAVSKVRAYLKQNEFPTPNEQKHVYYIKFKLKQYEDDRKEYNDLLSKIQQLMRNHANSLLEPREF